MGNTCSCLNNLISNNNQCDLSNKGMIEQKNEGTIENPTNKNIYESLKDNYNLKDDSLRQLKGTLNNNIIKNNSNRNTNLSTSHLSNINININNINKIINNYDNNYNKKESINIVKKNISIINDPKTVNINIIIKNFKGYIFRKKYEKYLKEELINFGKTLY